jgi:hypothetical protein
MLQQSSSAAVSSSSSVNSQDEKKINNSAGSTAQQNARSWTEKAFFAATENWDLQIGYLPETSFSFMPIK